MLVLDSISGFRAARAKLGRLAFVPTMGALHAGHMSLVHEARRHAPHVAVSIFVNPTQFGPTEDFTKYPRPIEDDLRMCRDAGVDCVFTPTAAEMYPAGVPITLLDLPPLTKTLEGRFRPTHFAGVCVVVLKLFNIVSPQIACFGEKDFQQLAVIRAMVKSLDLPIDIVGCPTFREADGLAMSSRNRYLNADERRRALSISRGLFAVQELARSGEISCEVLRRELRRHLEHAGDLPHVPTSIDYATVVDRDHLSELTTLDRPARAVVAMRVGTTRLIDNVPVNPN